MPAKHVATTAIRERFVLRPEQYRNARPFYTAKNRCQAPKFTRTNLPGVHQNRRYPPLFCGETQLRS